METKTKQRKTPFENSGHFIFKWKNYVEPM